MSKWKLLDYPKIYLGNIDDFEFAIQNHECIEIGGKYWRDFSQGISFDIFLMESRIWNPDFDTPTFHLK